MTLFDFATSADLSVPPDGGVTDALAACIGARPPNAAWGAKPSPWRLPMDGGALPDGGGVAPAPTPGTPAPGWALLDFQPQSCGFGATYSLDTFKGRPLAVALWAGW